MSVKNVDRRFFVRSMHNLLLSGQLYTMNVKKNGNSIR